MNYQKILFSLTFLFAWLCSISFSFAQEDSLRIYALNRYTSSWDYVSFRIGAGLQKNFYSEVGLSFQNVTIGCTGFFSRSYYTSLEVVPNFNQNESQSKNVYAIKTGIELNAMLLVLAIEAKYQTDFSKNAFVITPKVGLGAFGDVLLFYGYNFSTRHNHEKTFPFISNHQFSLIVNIHESFLGN